MPSRLRVPLVAMLFALAGCQNTTTNPETPQTTSSSRIFDDEGHPLAGIKVVSSTAPAGTKTDSNGAWTLPRKAIGRPDTFHVFVDALSAGAIALSANQASPADFQIVWRPLEGELPWNSYYPSPLYRIRIVVVRKSGDRDTVFAPSNPPRLDYSSRFPNLATDTSNDGYAYTEVFDSLGTVIRGNSFAFTKQPLTVQMPLHAFKNLAIDVYLGATWRYRDTSTVTATGIDTSILAKIQWSTSRDTIWRDGTNSLHVATPSGTSSPLFVRCRVASREGRVVVKEIAFRPKTPSSSWGPDAYRVPTPPRLTASFATNDSLILVSKATDTLGGTVVARKLVWSGGDTIQIVSDRQVLRPPSGKLDATLTARLFAIDDDGESTFVDLRTRPVEPPPNMTISEKTTRSFRVSWNEATVAGHDKIRIRVRDAINDSILIDSLVNAGLGTLLVPRIFIPTNLVFQSRFEGTKTDTGEWAAQRDSLPSGPFNPYWLRIYPGWLYMWTWTLPGKDTYWSYSIVPSTDTALTYFTGSTEVNPRGIAWGQAPHLRDSLVIEFQAVDSFSVRVECLSSLQVSAEGNTVGWKPRRVKAGKEVFRLSELSVMMTDLRKPTIVVPDSVAPLDLTARIACARNASGIRLSFECTENETVCPSRTTVVTVPSLEIR